MINEKRHEIKISTSDKLDAILQKKADELGIKKAELVKNFVVGELLKMGERDGKK